MSDDFQTYWNRLCVANPNLLQHEFSVKISVSSLHSLIEKSYKQGEKDAHGKRDRFFAEDSVLGNIFGV